MSKTISINTLETPSSIGGASTENEDYTQEAYNNEQWYSTTDAIDFAAFFLFFFSYLLFNIAYMVYHM